MNSTRKPSVLLFVFFLFIQSRLYASDYYWIGGTGNWTDLTHWATTSGGSTTYNQIPTADDDVFFDANSFAATGQTVTINAATALMHSMNWTGVTNMPTFKGPVSDLLKIYGSLTFATAMQVNISGSVDFEATNETNAIDLAGHAFQGYITFNATNGGWNLQSDFSSTNGSIAFNSGILTTNNYAVNASGFSTGGTLARTLNMGSSQFTLNGNGPSWSVSGSGITINAGTSVINLSGTVIPYFTGGNNHYYDLNFTAGGMNVNGQILDNDHFHNISFASAGTISNDTCESLTFQQNGTISSTTICQNLTLTPGYTCKINSGTILTITGSLNAAGSCGGYISLGASTAGSQATINHPTGALAGSFLILKDIKATGTGTFTAANSIDLGDNTGVAINAASVSGLYWVGNGGNWSDGNHWSLTSGGAPSGCSPTPMTNVYFDANSFSSAGQSVVLNVPTAYCRDMNWTGASGTPNFSGTFSNALNIFGSLTFIQSMTLSLAGTTSFNAATSGNTITSAGRIFNGEIDFNGTGAYGLSDSLNTTQTLALNAGSLTTNSNKVVAQKFYSSSSFARSLTLGASIVNLSNSTYCWQASSSGFSFDAGTSTINVNNAAYTYFAGGNLTYYDVNFNDADAAASCVLLGNNNFHDVMSKSNISISASNTFNNLSFLQNATVAASNTINNLTLTAGYNYSFGAGSTQTIAGSLSAAGQCGELINIASGNSGTKAFFSKSSGSVSASYLVLKDMGATGGAVFNVSNSVDLGDNSGWTLTSLAGKNLYWVGNAGNWSDGNHWALSSGGTPSGCSPTPLDNVFFDANSFSLSAQTVTLDAPIAYCHDMTWLGATGTPVLAGNSAGRLKIFGSLTFIGAMKITYSGNVDFQSSATGNTITSANHHFLNSVNFVGVGGGWTLQDSLITAQYLYHNNGTLNTNDQGVSAQIFYSNSGQTRELDMGASVFQLSSAAIFWDVTVAGLTLHPGTSTIVGTSNIVPMFFGGGMTYYDLKFTGADAGSSAYLYDANQFHNVTFTLRGIVQSSNTFNQLTFLSNGTLSSGNTFNTLILTAQYTYLFASGQTQTILNRWQVQGTCTSYIILSSTVSGSPALVSKSQGSVLGFNIHMNDISAQGGATFYAYNSVNLGDNAGWNFAILPTLLPPSFVVGPAAVCAGSVHVQYHTSPVDGAIYYQWAVPAGASIEEGQGDTVISVNFGTAATGTISVQTSNGCNYNTNGSSLTTIIQPAAPPSVSLAASPAGSVCAGTAITYTATATNTGASTVTYNFTVNGNSVQNSSASSFVYGNPANGDQISCDITTSGSNACSAVNTASSVPVTVSIGSAGNINPSVSLSASSAGAVCSGTSVTYTAAASNTGGGTVTYNFTVNGSSVQQTAANAYTTSGLANGDVLACQITIASGQCLASATAVSNSIKASISSAETPSVTIGASAQSICAGTRVYFTATVSGASAPAYQWYVNGQVAGANKSTFDSAGLKSGDVVTCDVADNTACAAPGPASSNSITMQVQEGLLPSVSISASAGGVCAGSTISFIASAENAGDPVYQWKVNGANAGDNSADFQSAKLADKDTVTCELSATTGCSVSTTVVSNAVVVTIWPNPVVTVDPPDVRIPYGNAVQLSASIAGTASSYAWSPATGLNDAGVQKPESHPEDDILYTVAVTDENACVGYGTAAVHVLRGLGIPNSFTPNHDGKNDLFRIPARTAITGLQSFAVYDRYGEKVFETHDISQGWDGTFNGLDEPMGNYVYMIRASSETGQVLLKGSVLLIR